MDAYAWHGVLMRNKRIQYLHEKQYSFTPQFGIARKKIDNEELNQTEPSRADCLLLLSSQRHAMAHQLASHKINIVLLLLLFSMQYLDFYWLHCAMCIHFVTVCTAYHTFTHTLCVVWWMHQDTNAIKVM